MTRTTAVLLAAGAGTRLGLGPKALLTFHGTPLVAHAAAELLRGGCAEVVVVIGAGADQVRKVPLPKGCRTVENIRWHEGMGTSFAIGVAEAAVSGAPILVALVDQPGMSAELIAELIARHTPGRITAAGYRSRHGVRPEHSSIAGESVPLRRGNPVMFSLEHATGAAAIAEGDSAARAYLAAHPEAVDVIDVSQLSDGADLDTTADLHLLH